MAYLTPEEETLSPEGIRALQREKLAAMLRAVLPANQFYQKKLGTIAEEWLRKGAPLSDLQSWPFTTRDELEADQRANPPYGTNLTFPLSSYSRLHQTSGSLGAPLRWLDRNEDWGWWRKLWGTIYRAAGVTDSDRFIFPFSFGPFIGFWGAFESAVALGNLSLPAGGMTTTGRLRFLIDNEVTVICCTPTYAIRMAETAVAEGIDLQQCKVRAIIVAGEPGGSIPATRERIESAWGAEVFDHSGMTEIGAYGFECAEGPLGLHVAENEFVVEVIDPDRLAPVGPGETGELVLTNLGRYGMPLIRYRTGDLVRFARNACPCGRSFIRLEGGIIGRRDEMVTIRGNNVFPGAIEAILRPIPGVAEYQIEVDETGALPDLRVIVESAPGADGTKVARAAAEAIRDRLNFRPVVSAVEPGTLPRYEMKSRRWIRRR